MEQNIEDLRKQLADRDLFLIHAAQARTDWSNRLKENIEKVAGKKIRAKGCIDNSKDAKYAIRNCKEGTVFIVAVLEMKHKHSQGLIEEMKKVPGSVVLTHRTGYNKDRIADGLMTATKMKEFNRIN